MEAPRDVHCGQGGSGASSGRLCRFWIHALRAATLCLSPCCIMPSSVSGSCVGQTSFRRAARQRRNAVYVGWFVLRARRRSLSVSQRAARWMTPMLSRCMESFAVVGVRYSASITPCASGRALLFSARSPLTLRMWPMALARLVMSSPRYCAVTTMSMPQPIVSPRELWGSRGKSEPSLTTETCVILAPCGRSYRSVCDVTLSCGKSVWRVGGAISVGAASVLGVRRALHCRANDAAARIGR